MDSHKILSHIPFLSNSEQAFVSLDDLEQSCPYSRGEIERCVRSNPYVVEDDEQHFYRISSQEYCSITMQIINNCLINGISFSSFSLDDVITACSSIPAFLIVCVLLERKNERTKERKNERTKVWHVLTI